MKTVQLKDKLFVESISEIAIQQRIQAIALQIDQDYQGKTPILIGVLNGAFRFLADLVKYISIPVQISFIKLASYHGNTSSSGSVKQLIGLDIDLTNQDVILVEDIVDTGLTAKALFENPILQNTQSLHFATLLFKKDSLKEAIDLKYVGFTIPNDFVVGYGLDYDNLGRELNEIYKFES